MTHDTRRFILAAGSNLTLPIRDMATRPGGWHGVRSQNQAQFLVQVFGTGLIWGVPPSYRITPIIDTDLCQRSTGKIARH